VKPCTGWSGEGMGPGPHIHSGHGHFLYRNQGRLADAERMYNRALARYEKALGSHYTSTLVTVNNLGVLYRDQGLDLV
jgi:hypothetical protein